MSPFAYRPLRTRRHRPLFAAAALLAVLGLFLLSGVPAGVALAACVGCFVLGCLHRLSGEDTRGAEFGNFIGG